MPAKGSTQRLQKLSNEIWKFHKYDFSNFVYVNQETASDIKCIEHNEVFKQTPNNHKKGFTGCPKCPSKKGKRKFDVHIFADIVHKKYNNKWRYVSGEPKHFKESKVKFHCEEHNIDFEKTFDNIINHGVGCRECGRSTQFTGSKLKIENRVSEHKIGSKLWSNTNNVVSNNVSINDMKTKYKWKCDVVDHVIWEDFPKRICIHLRGCPMCEIRREFKTSPVKSEENNFSLNKEGKLWWNYEKNGKLKPEDFTLASGQIVWFKCIGCVISHEFKMRICNFHIGERCPYKSSKLVDETNSLVLKFPFIVNYWNEEKNNKKPNEISFGSSQMIWLKCLKDHEWKTTPNTLKGYLNTDRSVINCPICCPIGISNISIDWLESIMKQENIYIQHGKNDKEFQIPDTSYRADGYCKETNTIYEFHGDYWHGNPDIFNPTDINPSNGKTFGELYEKTLIKENKIINLGYNLITIWENDYRNKKQ